MQPVGDSSLNTSSLQRIIGSTPAVISLRGISLSISLCKAYGVQKCHALVCVCVCWCDCMHAHVHTSIWSSFIIALFCPNGSYTNLRPSAWKLCFCWWYMLLTATTRVVPYPTYFSLLAVGFWLFLGFLLHICLTQQDLNGRSK